MWLVIYWSREWYAPLFIKHWTALVLFILKQTPWPHFKGSQRGTVRESSLFPINTLTTLSLCPTSCFYVTLRWMAAPSGVWCICLNSQLVVSFNILVFLLFSYLFKSYSFALGMLLPMLCWLLQQKSKLLKAWVLMRMPWGITVILMQMRHLERLGGIMNGDNCLTLRLTMNRDVSLIWQLNCEWRQ